eukprot:12400558-Alexandrium_andersonii.AAC.1
MATIHRELADVIVAEARLGGTTSDDRPVVPKAMPELRPAPLLHAAVRGGLWAGARRGHLSKGHQRLPAPSSRAAPSSDPARSCTPR